MEWLFLSCHNYWIVCRLVRDDDHPFLAFSPKISIEDSSKPFRALLGAILSTLKGAPVKPSTFNPDIQLDYFVNEIDAGPLPEDDLSDQPGVYLDSPSKDSATEPPITHNHSHVQHRLMVCPFVGSYLLHH